MASRCVLSTLLLLGKVQLLVIAGTVPVRYLCPGEEITLKCDHEALRKGNKINDVIWKVNDSRKNWQWTQIIHCSKSLECRITESKPAEGIEVLNISSGTLTIKSLSRNAAIRHLDFMCVIQTQEKPHKYRVEINLVEECILTQMGADVNLTEHLIDMVPRRQVKDVELYNIMRVGIKRQKQKFAYCSRNRTMRCRLVENDSPPPIFSNRLKEKDDSILLTGIQESDNDLEMQVEIYFHRGLYRKRSIGKAPRIFTLRIRVEASQDVDNASSSFDPSLKAELLHAYDDAPTVQTESGKVVGKIETLRLGKAVFCYLGIPYAEPPVGELRFAAPKPAKPWSEIRNATEYGAACPQPDYRLPVKNAIEENEDCLFLNVFVPSTIKPDEKLAVMVWIHGGRFTMGSSTEYPGHVLASFNDVIVVTINYRLGILGFFNDPSTGLKGNYGMYDQILALKWVQANIASFGGDPNRVTAFGESAGAFSISLHLISPLSKGLFNRAILQNGSASSPLLTGKAASSNTLKELTKIANCMSQAELTHCLRSKSAEEVISFQEKLSSNPSITSNEITIPVIDGKFLPGQPHSLYKHATFADQNVEVIIGFNSLNVVLKPGNVSQDGVSKDEFDSNVKSALERRIKKDRSRIVEELVKFQYTDHDDPNNKTTIRKMTIDFQSDLMTVAPAIFEASALAKAGKHCYLYVFEHRPDFSPFPPWAGAVRGVDVPFVFGVPFKRMSSKADFFIPRYSEIEKGFSMYIMKLWTDFAKFGSPTSPSSNSSLIMWRPYTEEDQFYLALDVTPRLKQRYRAREVTFWNKLIPEVTRKRRKGKMTKKL